MTYYEVEIRNSNLVGNAKDLSSLVSALRAVESEFQLGFCLNAGWCDECRYNPYETGSPLFHSFMIRERVALRLVLSGRFNWSKKKGIGRQSPTEYLEKLVKNGEEAWFQLEMYEL